MTDPQRPRTEAGLIFWQSNALRGFEDKLARAILAIEAEAAVLALREEGKVLRAAAAAADEPERGLPEGWFEEQERVRSREETPNG